MSDSFTLSRLAPHVRWVLWRNEDRKGRATKVPKQITGLEASSTDPKTWATRSACEAARERIGADGVGIILGDLGNGYTLAGIDLDSCITAGTTAPWAQEVLNQFGTYTELSPSLTGCKLFFRLRAGDMPRVRDLLGKDRLGRSWKAEAVGDHPPGIELYTGGRYFTVTDKALGEPDLAVITPDEIAWLIGFAGETFSPPQPPPHGGGLSQGRDQSRSALAFQIARRVRADGGDYAAFIAACRADAACKSWLLEKGLAHDEREAKRAWENATKGTTATPPREWPELDASILADDEPPPRLPLGLFPKPSQDYIEAAADHAGSPPDYVMLSLLSVIGAALGNARWGQAWGNFTQPPIIWGAGIGHPSAAKSPGLIDVAQGAIAALETHLNRDWEDRQRQHDTNKAEAAALTDRWKKEVDNAAKTGNAPPQRPDRAKEPEPLQKRRFAVRDATTQRLARMMAANPRGLLLFRDELAGWLGAMDRYNNGAGADRAFWLEAYGGRRFTVDTIRDGDAAPMIDHLTIGMIGALTVDKGRAAMAEQDNDGLAARLLYVWPASRKPSIPKGEPPDTMLRDALMKIVSLPWEPPEPLLLPFSKPAQAILQVRREMVAGADASGLLGAWIGKMPGHVIRLAVICQHLQWLADGGDPPREIDDLAVGRADALLAAYFLPMAARFFGVNALPQAARDARTLARVIVEERLERLNSRNQSRSAPIRDLDRVKAALLDLEAAGWVRRDPVRHGEGPGKPRDDWEVRPDLLTLLAPLARGAA
jgi:hypothetical protein